MIRTVTHKHLKRQFEIFEDNSEIDGLFAELQFSTLLIPVNPENDTLKFPVLTFEGKKYVPVFTDVHEYNKCNFGDDFTLIPNEIDFYLNLLDTKIDGIIIDIEGERFPLTGELQDLIKPNYIFDYDPNVFTAKEIKQIKNSISNIELEEFLDDESNYFDFESLIQLMLKSDLFKVVLSPKDLTCKIKNDVISMHDIGMLPAAISTKLTESFALVYTKESEIKPKNNPMHPYMQLVNLPEFINRILLDDLDGIILNENSQNITIPREYLLNFLKDFNSPNIDKYDDYAFPLEE